MLCAVWAPLWSSWKENCSFLVPSLIHYLQLPTCKVRNLTNSFLHWNLHPYRSIYMISKTLTGGLARAAISHVTHAMEFEMDSWFHMVNQRWKEQRDGITTEWKWEERYSITACFQLGSILLCESIKKKCWDCS